MKHNLLLCRLVLLSGLTLPSNVTALEVHEWGTFTVLVSSQGNTVNWYQPYSDTALLPAFTDNPKNRKQGIPTARVRMETPVIYFYPKEETTVHARVMFRNGSITERFPASQDDPYIRSGQMILSALSTPSGAISYVAKKTSDAIFDERVSKISNTLRPAVTYWSGKLLSPDHPDARLIPSVAGHKGENYGAARGVPDAWIFRSDSPVISGVNQLDIHPVEKFIFYRGAGQDVPPYIVTMSDEQTVTFTNYSASASGFQVALRVRDGQASWKKLPGLPEPKNHADRTTSITFPDETMSIEQADKELAALFLAELTQRGLTNDEAQAMIHTWNHTWFSEPGQRVFTIVDRAWVDFTLPLAISPEPTNIERVFVARYEILSPETEATLTALLRETPSSDQSVRDLASLPLGRFASGAAELAAEQMKRDALNKYRHLHHQTISKAPE